MSHIKDFFYDRFVLFALTINSFLLVVNILGTLLRLGGVGPYIHSYRSNLGLSSISVGGVGETLSFVIFTIGIFVMHIIFGIKFYGIRKEATWSIMALTTLTLILALIVSKSLLDLR